MDPLLSICIPTYNRADLLKRTLLSFEGGMNNVEVIINDNSDNDFSQEVVNQIMNSYYGPWQYNRNMPALGPIENMNEAIKKASGQFIYVLHDDDYLLAGGLKTICINLEERKDQNVIQFGVSLVDLTEKVLRIEKPKINEYLSPSEATFKVLSNSSFIRMPSIIINSRAYEELGYWDSTKAPPDDIDMFVRLCCKYGLYRITDMIAAYTIHEGAWTTKVFNEQTINILMGIFNDVKKINLLNEERLELAKSNFFHQFILAGSYRFIKKGQWSQAKKIINLFKLEEVKKMHTSYRWLPVKYLLIGATSFAKQ